MEQIKNSENGQELAQTNFNRWNNALKSGQAEEVAALYDRAVTFLPTMSKEFKTSQEDAEEYFKHFLEKKPEGEIIEDEYQPIGDDSYIHSGLYNFSIDGENDRQTVEARFSFVWQKDETGQWRIIHHHSSLKPKD